MGHVLGRGSERQQDGDDVPRGVAKHDVRRVPGGDDRPRGGRSMRPGSGGSAPSAKWLKTGDKFIAKIGPSAFRDALLRWFPLTDKPRPAVFRDNGLMPLPVNADFLKSINSGKVHFEINNGIPLGMSVTLTLLDKGRMPLLTIPQSTGDSVSVLAGVVASGEVVGPARVSRLVQLRRDEVRLFERAKYVRYGIGLATPGPGTVTFRSDHFITIRVWSELSYQVIP